LDYSDFIPEKKKYIYIGKPSFEKKGVSYIGYDFLLKKTLYRKTLLKLL